MMTAAGTSIAKFGSRRVPGRVVSRLFTFPFWMTVLIYAHGFRVEDEDSIWWERLAVAFAAGWWILLASLIACPAR